MTPGIAWLRLFRVSNLPTVWSNVVLGLAVGAATTRQHAQLGPAPLGVLLNEGFVLLVAATFSYAGAMAMNDAADAAVDVRERPGRPVPSGAISQRAAHRAGKFGVVGGLALLVVYDGPAVVFLGTLLALGIVLYNALHLRTRHAVVLPGLCRGLLVAVAVAVVPGVSPQEVALPAAIVAGVVVAISLYARNETEHVGRPARVGQLLSALPLLDGALVWAITGNLPAVALCVALALAAAVLRRVAPAS